METFRNLFRIGVLSFLVGGCCVSMSDGPSQGTIDVESERPLQKKVFVNRLMQSTIAIMSEDTVVRLPICSGVWISKDLILTAAHCVESENERLVFTYSTMEGYSTGDYGKATLVGIDEKIDLALLLAPGSADHPITSISSELLAPGDEVNIVGHPVGYDWTYSLGHISAIRKNQSGPIGKIEKIIQISAPMWMGNSGGGAFDSDGNLLGICSWISKSGPNLSFFIHKDVIQEFLLKHLSRF